LASTIDEIVNLLEDMRIPFPGERRIVIFSEQADDTRLHVTVVRQHEAFPTTPWTGPTEAKDEFRYERTFTLGTRPTLR
jgi:hypothetical protein